MPVTNSIKEFFDLNLQFINNGFGNEMAAANSKTPNNLATQLFQHIYDKYPEYQKETNHIAQELNVDYLDVVKVNISYDLSMGLFGCTTIVGLNEDQTHWIGRNMDWFFPDKIRENTEIINHSWGKSISIFGMIGVVTGISNNDFALIVNALPSNYHNWAAGAPVLYGVRNILENAGSYAEAVKSIESTAWMSSALLTVIGKNKGEAEVFEVGPFNNKRKNLQYPIVVTNNNEKEQLACYRYNRVKKLNPIQIQEMNTVLFDSNVKQEITAQSILIDFSKNQVNLI